MGGAGAELETSGGAGAELDTSGGRRPERLEETEPARLGLAAEGPTEGNQTAQSSRETVASGMQTDTGLGRLEQPDPGTVVTTRSGRAVRPPVRYGLDT